MRGRRFVTVWAMVAASACGRFGGVQGSGHPRTENRTVGGFHEIEISGGITATVAQDPTPSLRITADDNIVPLILTDVVGGRLRVRTERSISTSSPMNVEIHAPTIDGLGASGGSVLTGRDITPDQLALQASGGARVTLTGHVKGLSAALSGGVQLDASGLACERVRIDASGGVHATLNASQRIDGDLSGGVAVSVTGGPSVRNVTTSGAAFVSYR